MIEIVVACSSNCVIAKDGKIPWKKQKNDLKRFRDLTLHHPVIMGRKTYESLPRDLDKRFQIVMTENNDMEDCESYMVARNMKEAIDVALGKDEKVFVIGGEEIYAQFLPHTYTVHLTRIHIDIDDSEGKTRYFGLTEDWEIAEIEHCKADEDNEYDYDFVVFKRTKEILNDKTDGS